MEGKFLRGVLVGGIAGAALISQWDTLVKKCPFFEEIKGHVLFDEQGGPSRHSAADDSLQPKTRLMARRHRVKKVAD